MFRTKTRAGILRALIAGLVYALLLVLSYPPFWMWGLVFLTPIPLFVIARAPRLGPLRDAFWCAVGASPAWLFTHFWVKDVSALGLIPLVIILSAFTMLFVWLGARLSTRLGRHAIVLPLVWVGVEFFRGNLFATGYPWYLLAHPLVGSPMSVLAMPAAWGGVYLVSFLAAAYAALLLVTVTAPTHAKRKRTGLIGAILFAAWVMAGLLMVPGEPDVNKYVRFAAIQPDVPQDNRLEWTVRQRVRDWLTLRDLTIAASRDPRNPNPLDVIIWPEGFVPGWTLDPVSLETERAAGLAWAMTPRGPGDVPGLKGVPSRISATMVVDEMLAMQKAIGVPMLVGSVAFDNLRIVDAADGIEYQRDAMYNSAFILSKGEPQPVWYDKMHLTPFGEVMPYISASPWLEQKLLALGANGMDFVLDPGREPTVLSVPVARAGKRGEVRLATPICFEATIARVCRRLTFRDGRRRADVLVNMTNDGWFGASDAGRETHLMLARWRCIELATPMIRSANTGISCLISEKGQVINRDITPLDPQAPWEGYLIDQVPLGQTTTVYAQLGDLFAWACFLLTLVLAGVAIFHRAPVVSPIKGAD